MATPHRYTLRGALGHIAIVLLALPAFFFLPSVVDLVLCAVTFSVRMFGITAGYHRYLSHKSFRTSRAFQLVLASLGAAALQKGPLWWAASHRMHHLFTDTPRDPHNAREGFFWSHIGWIIDARADRIELDRVKDLARFPELRWLDRFYLVPWAILGVIVFAIGGWTGLVWGLFVSTLLTSHATFCVNSVCHFAREERGALARGGFFSRRRYATNDLSHNNWPTAIITLGEGWHNNHHYAPWAANQGHRWWELDVTYYVLRFLELLHIVWDVNRADAHGHRVARKHHPQRRPDDTSRPSHAVSFTGKRPKRSWRDSSPVPTPRH